VEPGLTTEVEVARRERDEHAGLADLGLRLAKAKQLTSALYAETVLLRVTRVGERRRCSSCGRRLTSKGRCPATFRSLFGDVLVRVRRLLVCPCQEAIEVKSFGVRDLGHDAVAPEPSYVTARYAALAPFGKVAVLLSELLPINGAQNAGTIRNRTLRVGEKVMRQHATETAQRAQPAPTGGAPFRGDCGQGDRRRWYPAPLRLCPLRPGDSHGCVRTRARRSQGASRHAGDCIVRWGCR